MDGKEVVCVSLLDSELNEKRDSHVCSFVMGRLKTTFSGARDLDCGDSGGGRAKANCHLIAPARLLALSESSIPPHQRPNVMDQRSDPLHPPVGEQEPLSFGHTCRIR